MGFGQAHGAEPLATGHLVQIGRLLLVGAVSVQGRVSTMCETRVHGPGLVGAVEHFIKTLVDHQWQTLAAELGLAGQCRPTAFDVFCVRLLEAVGSSDLVAGDIQRATLRITDLVERKDHLCGKFATFFKHGVDGVGICIGVGRHRLQVLRDLEHFMHDKLHVTQGWGIDGHERFSLKIQINGAVPGLAWGRP
ncbi:hypothetical protein GALL_462100 [mine drainage metagenome]|uniref:Uncharacterized protein n=1 Tax=mine drainage metagenome TaxID=410659 RepID=A0A1J5Q894_9ZZZZ